MTAEISGANNAPLMIDPVWPANLLQVEQSPGAAVLPSKVENWTRQLLNHLGRGAKCGYYWQINGNKKGTTWYETDNVPAPPPDLEGHLYFGIHGTAAIPQRVHPDTGKPRDPHAIRAILTDVAAVNCLFAEFDAKDFAGDKEAAFNEIEKCPLPPSVVIDSGGGYHCYWLLDQPQIVTDSNRGELARLQARWAGFVHGDPASKDLARVLRVPGSVNRKYDPPRPVTFVRGSMETQYTLDQLKACLPASLVPAPVPVVISGRPGAANPSTPQETGDYWVSRAYTQVSQQGSQNGAAVWLACQLRDAGMEQVQVVQYIWQFLSSLPELRAGDPWTVADASRITDSIFNRPPREPAGRNSMPEIRTIPPEPEFPPIEDIIADFDLHIHSTTAQPKVTAQAGFLAPELPAHARSNLQIAQLAGHFPDLYTDFALKVSPMTPRSFHETSALFLASVVIARRVKIPMPYDDIYPNLSIAWLAPTTLYKKTTGLNIPRRLLLRDFPHLLTPQDFTTESFISDLAGQEPFNLSSASSAEQEAWRKERDFAAQRGLVLDEFSGLLAGAGKDYNGGLLEAMLHFSDCDPLFVRSTRSQGRVVVRNSYLSFLGASTPAAVGRHFTQERLWSMGWWPRFIIMTPDSRPEWQDPQPTPEPPEISAALKRLNSRLPAAQWPNELPVISATIAPEAHRSWQAYNRACQEELLTDDLNGLLWGAYGRLPTHALKTALILAALDWEEDKSAPHIELRHMARAIVFAESWRESVHRALEQSNDNEYSRLAERLLYIISKSGSEGISFRDITRSMRDKVPTDIAAQLEQLLRAQLIEKFSRKPQGSGRPSECYRIIA